ncbi:restriction endonuclease subunit S [Flavobacterium columnare]|uniref:FclI S subunit n=1 Tax=Flavobacterium columnare TaxID=996 RepID=D7EZK5_9FLAO|nr:restriction endonuclease subunit S [Flavobacterium columnare]ACH89416.1 FclIS [Flavobacterium columnare]AGF25236.1 FclI S subunit [Flavobacterium columnare]QOG90556.1 restriction endonuclease subunit S [Flavobacterium columnare]QOG93210.1 restriction endonuclease subunit S [Flavobacterium columnare]QOG95877.1 restriction endonuclease subunit S [Flavobacterium columnare]
MVETQFKNTDIGLIPEDWEVKQLGEVITLINGRAYSQNELLFNGKYRVLRVGNFFSSDKWYWSNLELASKFYVNKGDLMYAWSASFGPKFWKNEKTIYHYHIWKIELSEYLDKFYLFYVLEKDKENILNQSQGGTMFHITKESMEKRKIPIPSLKEQQAIAEVLSDTDAWIESLEKLITKKRLVKQGAMQQLLTPKEDWEVKKLGEIAEVRDGTHQTPTYVESGIPFYSVESVTKNDFKNTKYISEQEHKILTKSFRIEKGDILMTRIGSIGDCKLIDWDVNASFYVSLALLKVKPIFSANYLCHYSKTENFKKEIDINSLQSAIPKKINLGPISNVKIEFPSLDEQQRIATILSDMDAEIEHLEKKLNKAKQLKQGIMQQLLTGKIRLIAGD